MKQQFLKEKTGTIAITIYQDNMAIIPDDSAKITLYKPGGTTVLQAEASATRNGTTGELTYSITTTHTAAHDLNYKAVWQYTSDGVTYYETQLFDVVKSILSIPITDLELYNELESLRKQNKQVKGTATAGAAGTLTDTGRNEDEDFWNGGKIEIIAGTGVGQIRLVTNFVKSTGVFTISPNWATNPDTTSIYIVTQTFTKKIAAAFNKLETLLYNKGKRHSLILESSQIEVPMIYLTIHTIALDFMDEVDDKWDRLATVYADKFNQAFNNMKLDYDEDESGGIDESEKQQSQTSLKIGRA